VNIYEWDVSGSYEINVFVILAPDLEAARAMLRAHLMEGYEWPAIDETTDPVTRDVVESRREEIERTVSKDPTVYSTDEPRILQYAYDG
jgi:hypothetical protein